MEEKTFFEEIKKLTDRMKSIQMIFSTTGEQLSVIVIPKYDVNDSAKDKLDPIVTIGTPEELSAGIFGKVKSAVSKVTDGFDNVAEFEKKAAKELKNTDAAKKTREADKKKAEQNKAKIDAIVKSITESLDVKTTNDKLIATAEKNLDSIKRIDAESKEIKNIEKLISEAKTKLMAPTMDFGDDDEF